MSSRAAEVAPDFIFAGRVFTLDAMLADHASNAALCDWLRVAKVGDSFGASFPERVEAVDPLELDGVAADVPRPLMVMTRYGLVDRKIIESDAHNARMEQRARDFMDWAEGRL